MPAEIEVTFAPVSGRAAAKAEPMPAFDGIATASETITAAATPSTIAAGPMDFARIANSGDAAVYVGIGTAPNAAQTPRWYLNVGQVLILSMPEGGKVAFVAK